MKTRNRNKARNRAASCTPPQKYITLRNSANADEYETFDIDVEYANGDLQNLHPYTRLAAHALQNALLSLYGNKNLTKLWLVAEGWRSPMRQRFMHMLGNSANEAWNSAHQYGMAVDVVPADAGEDWYTTNTPELTQIEKLARTFNLITLPDAHPGELVHTTWTALDKIVSFSEYDDSYDTVIPQELKN